MRRQFVGQIVSQTTTPEQHCFQEGDLDLYRLLSQDSSSGRSPGQRSGGPKFKSRCRFEFFSLEFKQILYVVPYTFKVSINGLEDLLQNCELTRLIIEQVKCIMSVCVCEQDPFCHFQFFTLIVAQFLTNFQSLSTVKMQSF